MATKKNPPKISKKLDAFNRSQQIYQVLEKGIIESEALLNSAADRPEDDAHIVELLESTSSGEQAVRLRPKSRPSISRSRPTPKKSAPKRAIKAKIKRRKR